MSATPAGDRDDSRASEAELWRAEVDDLRWQKQKLLVELEDALHPRKSIVWRARRLWHAAWQRYYIARWKLLHERDPKQGLKFRDRHDPCVARLRHPLLPDRPRILHFIGNFYTGGSARLVVDLVEHLGHAYEQRVVVRSLPPEPAYEGIDLVQLERLNGPRRVIAEIRRFKPHLVHIHMLGHQQDEYGKRDWSWYHQVFRAVEECGIRAIENINIPVEPYISPAVRCYVHVSDDVRERFGRVDSWNETIHPGSDLDFFARTAQIPVPDDTIGMVYRLQPDKLDEQSIEPFIEVVRRRRGTRALIVGGGQFLDLYKRRTNEEGVADAFTFTGYVPYSDLPAWIARMSLFVAPVHTESFGQVSPFAMGMALPVVGYDVGALREITNAPQLLAPAGNVAALSNVIIDLLDDRERRLRIGDENARRARELFSVQSMIQRYESVYAEVRTTKRGWVTQIGSAARPSLRGTTPVQSAPAVTVLMAVRNGERFLRETIDSILNQHFDDFEFLVVDDASTDGTQAILRSYRDPRIRVLVNEQHLGLSRSLNRGIGEARGRYIARTDADDISEPERLARQVQLLDGRPDIALVGSCYTIIDEEGRETGRRWVPCDQHEIRWMLQFCNAFAHSAVMLRRQVLNTVGHYDESLAYAMDYDLWLRIAARGRVGNLNEFLLRWRTSPASLTSTLGDGTERFDRVTADLGRQLGWPAEAPGKERKVELLCGIIAGSPPDTSVDEARWAVRTLFVLHDRYCREHAIEAQIERDLRRSLQRHVARCLFWMGHRYPDAHDYRYALGMLTSGAKVQPRGLLTHEGGSLLVKLALGGRFAVSAARAMRQAFIRDAGAIT